MKKLLMCGIMLLSFATFTTAFAEGGKAGKGDVECCCGKCECEECRCEEDCAGCEGCREEYYCRDCEAYHCQDDGACCHERHKKHHRRGHRHGCCRNC